jgi:signal transduction histidine kinase
VSAAGRLKPRRLAAALVAAAITALAVGVGLIDAVGERIISRRQQEVAEAARDYFVDFAHEEGLAPLARSLELRERTHHAAGFRYAVFDSNGTLVGGAKLLGWSQLPDAGISQLSINQAGRSSPWQVLVQPIATGGTLVVYEDLGDRVRFRQTLALGAAIALAVALTSLLAATLWVTRLIYARTDAIARTADDVVKGRSSARAPAAEGGDVFDRLGAAINAMLDRNDELITGLRTVTDSLAHDLRSPLTRLKTSLSRALEPEQDERVRRDLIGQAWDQADQALAITGALLDIARAETGVSRELFQTIDLGTILQDVAELFGPVVEDAGQSLAVRPSNRPIRLQGHEILIRQAIGNLIHNAARHAGAGAQVEVRIEDAPQVVKCIVSDNGRGIPEGDRGRVVERFVRLDAARTAAGSGLGLAIAAACAKLHRGRLLLEDNAPGLRVVLELARG